VESPFVNSSCGVFSNTFGVHFFQLTSESIKNINNPINLYVPKKHELFDLLKKIGHQTMEFQMRFLDVSDLSNLPKDSKRSIKKQYDMAKYFTRKMMTLL